VKYGDLKKSIFDGKSNLTKKKSFTVIKNYFIEMFSK